MIPIQTKTLLSYVCRFVYNQLGLSCNILLGLKLAQVFSPMLWPSSTYPTLPLYRVSMLIVIFTWCWLQGNLKLFDCKENLNLTREFPKSPDTQFWFQLKGFTLSLLMKIFNYEKIVSAILKPKKCKYFFLFVRIIYTIYLLVTACNEVIPSKV